MTVAVSHEPPPPRGQPSGDDFVVDEAILAAYGLVEEAGLLSGVSLELWEHLPEDFCRDHELDRGRLVTRQSGSRGHQKASRRLANHLEKAAQAAVGDGAYPCLDVNQDVDVRLWDVPAATVRRPDVLIHRCLKPGVDLWAEHPLLAVEIVSPTSRATDTGQDNPGSGFESKMTQYARAGIADYWIVRLKPDDSAIESIEEWRLEEGLGKYALTTVWSADSSPGAVRTDRPFPIDISWPDLEF